MKYSVAAIVLAAASSASAWSNDTVVYTTDVVDVYVTVCPAGASVTVGGSTYTNTLTVSSTLTVTDCPCTIVKPVYTTSAVVAPTTPAAPVYPVYPNATTPVPNAPVAPTAPVVGSTVAPSSSPSGVVPASGGNKAFAMSGASLAGLLGLAAYLL
jgi:hypothetical protein